MDLTPTERQLALRAEARAALADPVVRRHLADLAREREPDIRPLYRELGRRGLLAVGWPVEYGGRGAGHLDAAAVMEELVMGGVPDMAHVLSVQIVGLFVIMAGSPEQKAHHLPALAAGERLATVLYTEPDAGSDLAALQTAAVPDGDGYVLTGTKVYGLKSRLSDLALCAARTPAAGDPPDGAPAARYDGISLFLVDLNAEGVRRGSIASLADEQFDRVELDGVRVGPEALLGRPGDGWSLLNRCLAIERTGLDYSLKARRWYATALEGLAPGPVDDSVLVHVGRHGAAVTAAQLLAWDTVGRLDRGELEPAAAAVAKYHTSETAQEVALWAAGLHGLGYQRAGSGADLVLEAAFREAPGLTLAAGTSEVMLEIIGSTAADRIGEG